MNALWIQRLSDYVHTPLAIKSLENIIRSKIRQRGVLLIKYNTDIFFLTKKHISTSQELLLLEARAARHFWKQYKKLLGLHADFETRRPRAGDPVNLLLDIGYHNLAQKVLGIFEKHNTSPVLGVLHKTRNSDSSPLVYDLMELFRADIVDAEVLRFFRLKKKKVVALSQKDIASFVHDVEDRYKKRFYLRRFRQCHTYLYYMELQVLKYISAVNHKKVFVPILLPRRHDTRCG